MTGCVAPSTEAYGRGTKFDHSRRIETLREYILVYGPRGGRPLPAGDRRDVAPDRLSGSPYEAPAPTVDAVVPLSELYQKIGLVAPKGIEEPSPCPPEVRVPKSNRASEAGFQPQGVDPLQQDVDSLARGIREHRRGSDDQEAIVANRQEVGRHLLQIVADLQEVMRHLLQVADDPQEVRRYLLQVVDDRQQTTHHLLQVVDGLGPGARASEAPDAGLGLGAIRMSP